MRHFWLSYFITTLLVCILVGLIAWVVVPYIRHNNNFLVSPLPTFLTMTENFQVSTLDLWKPFIKDVLGSETGHHVAATSAFVYDLVDNKVVFDKDPTKRVPVASLTKIMTAVIALENNKPDDRYVVSSRALVGENSMGLTAGEVLTLGELMYGLFLNSGNDAAEVLADNYPLGREKFVEAMNKKAEALGLTNTHFTNPTGLQGDGDQYSTAYDLLVITRYGLERFPLFGKVASTFSITLPYSHNHKEFYLENETNLLSTYPGVKGIKTGYTPEAGLCLVTYLDYKGKKLIAVLLGSQDRRREMVELLDFSLKSLGITPPKYTGSRLDGV